MTAADVRSEHVEAILSLNPKQRRAFQRVLEAKQLGFIGAFSGRTADERLGEVCAREASARANPLDVLFQERA